MEYNTKRAEFDNVINNIVSLSKRYNFTTQIVGSYALHLYDVIDLSGVHDLDVVIYTAPSNLPKVLSLFSGMSVQEQGKRQYDYTKNNYSNDNACNTKAKRFVLNINGVEICVFVFTDVVELCEYTRDTDAYITNNLGKLNHLGAIVKPISKILSVKRSMGRRKDEKHIIKIAKLLFPNFKKIPFSRVLLKL